MTTKSRPRRVPRMTRNLTGRRLVVTGAARGIGESVARLAVAREAQVALIGLEPDRLRRIADDLGPAASWCEADVRDGPALREAIDKSAALMGGIDLVVANAGIVSYGTVRQVDESAFERVLDVNVNGVFRTLKYTTPHLASSRGYVTAVASALSFMPHLVRRRRGDREERRWQDRQGGAAREPQHRRTRGKPRLT